jgi:sulfite dehydrogenase (cytochrome) subunit B
MLALALAIASIVIVQPANAGRDRPAAYTLPEERVALRPGPGVETAQGNCLSCHSADYVTTQPPQMGADFWRAVVSKMVKVYHAPVSDEDAAVIVNYLSRTY